MNKVVYIFLSLVVTFKSFPVSVLFCIQGKNEKPIILNKCTEEGEPIGVDLDEAELPFGFHRLPILRAHGQRSVGRSRIGKIDLLNAEGFAI